MSYFKIFLNVSMFWIMLLKTQQSWMLAAEAPLALPAACSGCCTCCLSHRFEDESEANRFHC